MQKKCSNETSTMEVVDPSKYRSFCFRGEGRCNFVISAKEKQSNLRIVWRLAKHRKSGMMTAKPKCEVVNQYLEKIVSHFLSETCLIRAKIVLIPADKLHHLAKIPALPHNMKIEAWEELKEEAKFPSAISFFNASPGLRDDDFSQIPTAAKCGQIFLNNNSATSLQGGVARQNSASASAFVCALEMPDATRIPRHLAYVYGPTITVEIKPKQGFAQSHPGISDIPFCNNCILQIEKWRSAAFTAMYDFCPLELYSGERARMCATIDSLVRDPHRNLRIFVDGNVVHEENEVLPRDQLGAICFPTLAAANANGLAVGGVETLVSAIACILAGVHDDQNDDFRLHEDSVLSDLLKAQRIDTIGIVRAYDYYRKLSPNVQHELMNKSNLLHRGGLSFLRGMDARSLVERYLLAATMKDCSLMVSLRLVDRRAIGALQDDPACKLVRVRAPGAASVENGGSLYFAYSTRIVDLDPKSAKNLENAYLRFISGVEAIRSNPNIHPPCRI